MWEKPRQMESDAFTLYNAGYTYILCSIVIREEIERIHNTVATESVSLLQP